MSGDFTMEIDEFGQPSATCTHCKSWRLVCVGCRKPLLDASYRVHEPYGSNDSRAEIRACWDCYRRIVNAVRREVGLPLWKRD